MKTAERKFLRATAVAIVLGFTCAMPVAAQTSAGSSSAQGTSGGQSASSGGSSDTRSAAAGQSAPSDFNANRRVDEKDTNWGWIGLLGLAGLAGLLRKRETHDVDYQARRPTT